MWKCKVCEEKDKRISDLASQIDLLRALVFPKNSKTGTPESQELDRLLSGSSEPLPIILSDTEREAHFLLTGNYDNSQGDFN